MRQLTSQPVQDPDWFQRTAVAIELVQPHHIEENVEFYRGRRIPETIIAIRSSHDIGAELLVNIRIKVRLIALVNPNAVLYQVINELVGRSIDETYGTEDSVETVGSVNRKQ